MEHNRNEKMSTTTWVNVNESQTITSKKSKLQKDAFNISFMLNINVKNRILFV